MPPYYQLLHVGAVQLAPTAQVESTVKAYFKLASTTETTDESPQLIEQLVPLQLATHLVPGTVWSAEGKITSAGLRTQPDQRTLSLGKRALRTRPLHKIFPPSKGLPACLQHAPIDALYAVVTIPGEQVLIPCFELLRVFYYQHAGKLTSYFLSRLPLDSLCWLLASPTRQNDFTAHFCVASTSISIQGARILAELLCNTFYRRAIEHTHAQLALDWHACSTQKRLTEAYPTVSFQLGRDIQVTAQGQAFTVRKKAYFLVRKLVLPTDWYSFKSVVYHQLRDSPLLPHAAPDFGKLLNLEYQDVLLGRQHQLQQPPTAAGVSFRQWRSDDSSATTIRNEGPPVTQAFSWARRIAAHVPAVFADSSILHRLWARPGYEPQGVKSLLPANEKIMQIIKLLRTFGCTVDLVEVNNPKHRFGKGRSVFPYVYAPDTHTHLPNLHYRPLSIARVQWGGGHFYLFNILDDNTLTCVNRKDLLAWAKDELTNFVLQVMRASCDWLRVRSQLPGHTILSYVFKHCEVIASTVHLAMRIIIASYNRASARQTELNSVGLRNYPISVQKAMIALSYKHHDTLHYPGNHIGESPVARSEMPADFYRTKYDSLSDEELEQALLAEKNVKSAKSNRRY